MKNCVLALSIFLLVGCATSSTNLNKVSVGMTKAEVIKIMGEPESTRANQAAEYLVYTLHDNTGLVAVQGVGMYPVPVNNQYFVKLVGGHVESYGRVGDFDSTNPQRVDLQINSQGSTSTKQPSAYDIACQNGFKAYDNKDYKTAIVFFQSAIDLDHSLPVGWACLGLAQAYSRNYLDALYSLKRALELNPNDQLKVLTLSGLAGIYGMLDETTKYAETLELVRKLNPKSADDVVKIVQEEKAKKSLVAPEQK